jgi:hypothetical protein
VFPRDAAGRNMVYCHQNLVFREINKGVTLLVVWPRVQELENLVA